MRIKQPGQPTPRPPEAATFLAPEQDLEVDVEFDPRRDITHRDWEGMRSKLERYLGMSADLAFVGLAANMATLFPERRDELPLEAVRAAIDNNLKRSREQNDWGAFARLAEGRLILFPDRAVELILDDAAWEGMKKELDTCLDNHEWFRTPVFARRLAMLFPSRRHDLGLDGNILTELIASLERCKRERMWSFYVDAVAAVVTIYPERRKDIDIDQAAWKAMKQLFERRRKMDEWDGVADLAVTLTILAAQDARITSAGQIRITPKKPKLIAEPTPLPARSR